jgi:hypothetical protein
VFVSPSGRISIVFEAEFAASAHVAEVTAVVEVATGKVLTRTYLVDVKLPLDKYARNPPELLNVLKTFSRVCRKSKVDVLSPLMVVEPSPVDSVVPFAAISKLTVGEPSIEPSESDS